jgi:hypothetical protein
MLVMATNKNPHHQLDPRTVSRILRIPVLPSSLRHPFHILVRLLHHHRRVTTVISVITQGEGAEGADIEMACEVAVVIKVTITKASTGTVRHIPVTTNPRQTRHRLERRRSVR